MLTAYKPLSGIFVEQEGAEGESIVVVTDGAENKTIIVQKGAEGETIVVQEGTEGDQLWSFQRALKIKQLSLIHI